VYLDGPITDERTALWESRLSSPDPDRLCVLLVKAEGTLLGFACAFLDDESSGGANLNDPHISPRLRGQGLGRKLFKKAAQ
jgi:GNAT superfamily N-acetyltransferase